MISRRGLIGGLMALATPAIVRTPGLLMPIRSLRLEITLEEYSIRILQPMMAKLADQIAQQLLNGGEAWWMLSELPVGAEVAVKPPLMPLVYRPLNWPTGVLRTL